MISILKVFNSYTKEEIQKQLIELAQNGTLDAIKFYGRHNVIPDFRRVDSQIVITAILSPDKIMIDDELWNEEQGLSIFDLFIDQENISVLNPNFIKVGDNYEYVELNGEIYNFTKKAERDLLKELFQKTKDGYFGLSEEEAKKVIGSESHEPFRPDKIFKKSGAYNKIIGTERSHLVLLIKIP